MSTHVNSNKHKAGLEATHSTKAQRAGDEEVMDKTSMRSVRKRRIGRKTSDAPPDAAAKSEQLNAIPTLSSGCNDVTSKKREAPNEASPPAKKVKMVKSEPASQLKSLQNHFEELPQELQDMIFDFTFLAGPSVQHISRDYRPPSCLQVSKATREKFAKQYYELTTFHIPENLSPWAWVSSISAENRPRIQTIHCQHSYPRPKRDQHAQESGDPTLLAFHGGFWALLDAYSSMVLEAWTCRDTLELALSYLGVPRGALHVNLRFDYQDEIWTLSPKQEFLDWCKWKKREVWRIYLKWATAARQASSDV